MLDLSSEQLRLYRVIVRLWRRIRLLSVDPRAPDCLKPLFKRAPSLPQELLGGCQLLANRQTLLERLPKQSVCAELGTQEGRFASAILRTTHPCELHIVDLDLSKLECRECLVADSAVTLHEMDSAACLKQFPDNYFDWIYIDADHSYQAVRRDADVALRKIKKDGMVVFNDYILWSHEEMVPYGVVAAVNEICIEHNLAWVYFALNDSMYCDVALRRHSAYTSASLGQ